MKKLISCALACVMIATSLLLGGCSKSEAMQPPKGVATRYSQYDLSEYIKLGDYSKSKYTIVDTAVTDAMIEERIAEALDEHATLEIVDDRPAQMGDTVVINFYGMMDGEKLENGSATEQSLTLGSGQYIDGFEEGLVGAKTGETVRLNLKFPDPYPNNPDLAGKPVEFSVLIRYIKGKILPELTDEFVQNVTEGEYTTVAEYRESFVAVVEKELKNTAEEVKHNESCETFLEECEIIKLPETEVNEYITDMTEYYNEMADVYGMTIEEMFGVDEETFNSQIKQMAERQVTQEILLYAVIQEEKLELTQQKYDEILLNFAEASEMTVEDFSAEYEADVLWDLVLRRLAMDFISSKANAVESTAADTTAVTAADTAAVE